MFCCFSTGKQKYIRVPFQKFVGKCHRQVLGEADGSTGTTHWRTNVDSAEWAALDTEMGGQVVDHTLEHHQNGQPKTQMITHILGGPCPNNHTITNPLMDEGILYWCFFCYTAPYPRKPNQRIHLWPKERIAWSTTQVHVVRLLGIFSRGMIKNVQPCCTVRPRLHLTSDSAHPCEVLNVVDLLAAFWQQER